MQLEVYLARFPDVFGYSLPADLCSDTSLPPQMTARVVLGLRTGVAGDVAVWDAGSVPEPLARLYLAECDGLLVVGEHVRPREGRTEPSRSRVVLRASSEMLSDPRVVFLKSPDGRRGADNRDVLHHSWKQRQNFSSLVL